METRTTRTRDNPPAPGGTTTSWLCQRSSHRHVRILAHTGNQYHVILCPGQESTPKTPRSSRSHGRAPGRSSGERIRRADQWGPCQTTCSSRAVPPSRENAANAKRPQRRRFCLGNPSCRISFEDVFLFSLPIRRDACLRRAATLSARSATPRPALSCVAILIREVVGFSCGGEAESKRGAGSDQEGPYVVRSWQSGQEDGQFCGWLEMLALAGLAVGCTGRSHSKWTPRRRV
jgi:hypothetical protein